MMMTVFLKSTIRPCESVSRPSSSTCSRLLKISGWAFSSQPHSSKTTWLEIFQPRLSQSGTISNQNATEANITAENTFNSPDGLGFDADGRLWIQTDGNYSNAGEYEGQGNNQMLCADPASKEIRRFFVGPKECEVTGLTFTPDRRTLFINIQHPGEGGDSHWPEGGNALPRSATIVITKNDGGVIGS